MELCLSFSIPYKIPVVNGVDIDLYLLYSLVQQRGGLSKVSMLVPIYFNRNVTFHVY